MTAVSEVPQLRRVLVALDMAGGGQAALETTANLAAAFGAELVGLFVEDAELLEAAALPVSRWVSSGAATQAPFDVSLMRRALKVSALQASRVLAEVAMRQRIQWTFRVKQGALVEQFLAELGPSDILALVAPSDRRGQARAAMHWRLIAAEAHCCVLLVRPGGRPAQPVVALYTGSQRVLAVAEQLARAYHRPLIVLAAAETTEAVTAQVETASRWLEAGAISAPVRGIVAQSVSEIDAAAATLYPGVLVIGPAEGSAAKGYDLDTLIEHPPCSLFILR
jgi:nucleotide-binding universal stress UspA family protein